MTLRLLNIAMLLSFLLGYMEWGGGNSAFIADVEWTVFTSGDNFLNNLFHPVILPGFVGQGLLLYAAVAKRPRKWINVTGIVLLSLIMLLILFTGVVSASLWIILSVLPFFAFAVLFFVLKKKQLRTSVL